CQSDAKIDPPMSRIQITPDLNADSLEKFKDVLLVVNFNYPKYDAIEPYLSIYQPYFPNIKFVGPEVPDNLKNQVMEINPDGVKPDGGFTSSYRGLAEIMEMYPKYAGYLYTNDDTVLNVHQLFGFDLNKVWKRIPSLDEIRDQSKPPTTEWYWWDVEAGATTAFWDDPTSFTDKQLERVHNFTK
ncbi:hypothetical protein BGZ83_004923, partial [Gryganskiella cystojenkinii]